MEINWFGEHDIATPASPPGRGPIATIFLQWICSLVFMAAACGVYGADTETAKRVLIISTGSRYSPGFTLVDRVILDALANLPTGPIETYGENLDILRFPE